MEIPYIVTPRKDTGLFNSKIAIWLFLASEVMLFGGFFSAYVFLRLGADYPWPERTLPVLPGLINTFILIASSVTVVFAWASLKMRQWRRFQFFMGITVACAAVFMVFKALEYNVKFGHQAVRLQDYTVVEGHLGYEMENDKPVLDHHGKKIEENRILIQTSGLTFNTVRFHKPWIEELLSQASHRNSKITLAADVTAVTEEGKPAQTLAKAGEELSIDLLTKLQKVHLDARAHNGALRTAALRQEWVTAKEANPGKRGWQIASGVNINVEALAPKLLTEIGTVAFKVEPPARFDFKPRDVREAESQSRLRDDTVVDGKLLASPMVFHNVDALDFRHLAMKAKEKGQDPASVIEGSWILKENHELKEVWEKQQKALAQLTEDLAKHGKEPTVKDKYRIGWQEMAYYSTTKLEDVKIEPGAHAMPAVSTALKEHFMGPDYKAREANHSFPHLSVPREQVQFGAKFTPAWNTYYAIYFTITGLHGLHVIGGALVLCYYLFFGRKMYETNPEWLANRVEIGGLFWHFVDLVWIFAFPIFYLM